MWLGAVCPSLALLALGFFDVLVAGEAFAVAPVLEFELPVKELEAVAVLHVHITDAEC